MIDFSSYRAAIISPPAQITPEFIALVRKYRPIGLIFMGRSVKGKTPAQVRALIQENFPRVHFILIDQEGGKVMRLRGGDFYEAPPFASFGTLYDTDPTTALAAIRKNGERIAADLVACGINVDCAPCLDLSVGEPDKAGGPHVIAGLGRGLHHDPGVVTVLGGEFCEALVAAGVIPVIKHLPGHGRSMGADPHEGMCHVNASLDTLAADLAPFQAVARRFSGLWGMTSHVIYDTIDQENPATCSRVIIQDIIRGNIGFKGFLISDAVDMKALAHIGIRTLIAQTLAAGIDAILYCGDDLDIATQILTSVPFLTAASITRLEITRAMMAAGRRKSCTI